LIQQFGSPADDDRRLISEQKDIAKRCRVPTGFVGKRNRIIEQTLDQEIDLVDVVRSLVPSDAG
jgi:hypothetical protein